MNEDEKILSLLREGRPAGPQAGVRERVVAAALDVRRRERRRWLRVASAAAVWLVVIVSCLLAERRESARTEMLVDGSRESSARREADALAAEFRDIPGAKGIAERMLMCREETEAALWAAQIRAELKTLSEE
jgi:hypothetical protein